MVDHNKNIIQKDSEQSMDIAGGFYEVEKDGKLFMVYYHTKYHPIPQTQTLTLSNKTKKDDQILFLCPSVRIHDSPFVNKSYKKDFSIYKYHFSLISPEYVSEKIWNPPHPHPIFCHSVLPLYWCNNKEFDVDGGCKICRGSNFGTDYYFCAVCNENFHKECVESPLQIKHPYHPEHSLQIYNHLVTDPYMECLCCGKRVIGQVYNCTICQAFIHTVCAMKTIPFFIDQPKRHDHLLTFFPRQTSLTCNVCGLLRRNYPTYICARCNFVAHNDCMYSPNIIKISRHNHRISYTSSLSSGETSCGVCHQSIDSNYGGYTCDKCVDYGVHSRCALGKDVWDGKDLQDVSEENDIIQDLEPFDIITEGVILHFLHDHYLHLKVNIIYDENKHCQACVLPIFEGNFYICIECDFILHESCAKARRITQHVLHPHPLTLMLINQSFDDWFECNACERYCAGFAYKCGLGECSFYLDVRCALLFEPFGFKGHSHPLFLGSDLLGKHICHICKTECHKQYFNCIKCDFIVCIKCVTLPYIVRYKHVKHFLTVLPENEVRVEDWCEVCERSIKDSNTKVIYWCKEYCTTLHIECLFGRDQYLKPGRYFVDSDEVQIIGKSNHAPPFCQMCKNLCLGKIFKIEDCRYLLCSVKCCYVVLARGYNRGYVGIHYNDYTRLVQPY